MAPTDRPADPVRRAPEWGPPLIYSIVSLLFTAAISSIITQRHGLVPGILAGIAYGAMFLPSILWSAWASAWYQRHPWLNVVQFTLIYFILIAAIFPDYSLIRSGLGALAAGVIVGGLIALIRRYQRRSTP
ncbi:hypothetical protein Aple_057940 [Acrocarpospora pleiomorpha]|uniref:Uncharacterized protein n=1 Tax=Acrocarpospora pleiomorpha TaxID=90975 RepID=A0A5M3XNI6_9ACTN|nr:hypothetical protein [Acrocarpospora pleiomorpha]GES22895.1 hypothetical protein Aple_057940 [Acrocarpospora pleiomorpha]